MASNPLNACFSRNESKDSPLGTGYSGKKYSPVDNETLQDFATSKVFFNAILNCLLNNASISFEDLINCSCEKSFSLLLSLIDVLLLIQTLISWISKSSFLQNIQSLVAITGIQSFDARLTTFLEIEFSNSFSKNWHSTNKFSLKIFLYS